MAQIHGLCDPRFSTLRTLLQTNIDSGSELGTSLAVVIDGTLVVDLWGGYFDETKSKTKQWQKDTIVNVWSTTKCIASLAALMVVDRGLLDLDENVGTYWPEFAVNGKEQVKVRQVMSHTSGLAGWEKPATLEEVYDVRRSCERLAGLVAWWEPGTASGYHTLTHGHLVSELVRRRTGKGLKQFVDEEVAGPLGADFQIGVRRGDYGRVTDVVPPPVRRLRPDILRPEIPPDSVMGKAMNAPALPAAAANTKAWRDAEIGAVNGHGNARSIARILSPIALGGVVDGTKYLSTKTIDRIFEEQSHGIDLVEGRIHRFGIGLGLPAEDAEWNWVPTTGRICGWGGWGGSMGIVDVDRRMTIGYAMNKMQDVGLGSDLTKVYVAEIYRVLGVQV